MAITVRTCFANPHTTSLIGGQVGNHKKERKDHKLYQHCETGFVREW